MPISPERLREIRDLMLHYIYEHGAGRIKWEVKIEEVKSALNLTREEYVAGYSVLRNQGLLLARGTMDSIGINRDGQIAAESLGPRVSMQKPSSSNAVSIHAIYSVVQVGGTHIARKMPNLVSISRELRTSSMK